MTSDPLIPEIAKILNMSVSELENKPSDIQNLLCHIYKRHYRSDKTTLQIALSEIITNNKTTKEIEAAKEKKERKIVETAA